MIRLATEVGLPPNQIKRWTDQLLDGVSGVLGDTPEAGTEPESDVTSLHAKIGRLTLEKDFSEGARARAGLLPSARKGRSAPKGRACPGRPG
jgi:transposase-like protein